VALITFSLGTGFPSLDRFRWACPGASDNWRLPRIVHNKVEIPSRDPPPEAADRGWGFRALTTLHV